MIIFFNGSSRATLHLMLHPWHKYWTTFMKCSYTFVRVSSDVHKVKPTSSWRPHFIYLFNLFLHFFIGSVHFVQNLFTGIIIEISLFNFLNAANCCQATKYFRCRNHLLCLRISSYGRKVTLLWSEVYEREVVDSQEQTLISWTSVLINDSQKILARNNVGEGLAMCTVNAGNGVIMQVGDGVEGA